MNARCAGKKLWDPLRTRAIPEHLRDVITTRRYINPCLPLPISSNDVCVCLELVRGDICSGHISQSDVGADIAVCSLPLRSAHTEDLTQSFSCLRQRRISFLFLCFPLPVLRGPLNFFFWGGEGNFGDYLLRWAVLTVLWIGFCHSGLPYLWIDWFLFICVYCVCFCFILHTFVLLWAQWGGSGQLKPESFGPIFLQCFDTVGWVIWPVKTCPQYDLLCVGH